MDENVHLFEDLPVECLDLNIIETIVLGTEETSVPSIKSQSFISLELLPREMEEGFH